MGKLIIRTERPVEAITINKKLIDKMYILDKIVSSVLDKLKNKFPVGYRRIIGVKNYTFYTFTFAKHLRKLCRNAKSVQVGQYTFFTPKRTKKHILVSSFLSQLQHNTYLVSQKSVLKRRAKIFKYSSYFVPLLNERDYRFILGYVRKIKTNSVIKVFLFLKYKWFIEEDIQIPRGRVYVKR